MTNPPPCTSKSRPGAAILSGVYTRTRTSGAPLGPGTDLSRTDTPESSTSPTRSSRILLTRLRVASMSPRSPMSGISGTTAARSGSNGYSTEASHAFNWTFEIQFIVYLTNSRMDQGKSPGVVPYTGPQQISDGGFTGHAPTALPRRRSL